MSNREGEGGVCFATYIEKMYNLGISILKSYHTYIYNNITTQ